MIGLLKKKLRERIASGSATLNALHASKQQTPTMGGVLILTGFVVALYSTASRTGMATRFIAITAITLCFVGAADDWIKATTTRKGLTVRQKLLAQSLISFSAAAWLFFYHAEGKSPFSLLGWLPEEIRWLYIPWAAFVIIAVTNAVNLTDGLDGLAAGCTVVTSVATTLILFAGTVTVTNSADIMAVAISSSALAGAATGFLWFNRFPAKVFMGDAGSLPIGGILALAGLMSGTELLLLATGSVFVVETLSVIVQVYWFRRTGRRVLLCSPLHNHFVFRKVPEKRIVQAFWFAAVIMACVGAAMAISKLWG